MTPQGEPRYVQEAEGDLGALESKHVAIIGYGNLGRPFALNLRDSGVAPITVADLPGSAWEQALADGFAVKPVASATTCGEIVFILLPDELAAAVYKKEVAPSLAPGSAIVFASGFNLAFGRICPASDLDVLLLAPRMMGSAIRRKYRKGLGFPSFVSLEQDATGTGWGVLCALAKAVGSLRAGALTVSATQEAQLDLFVEQTVGPDLASAILTAFQVGVDAGLPPEALLLELYMSGEMATTFQTMADLGFFQQVKQHGFAAAYGGLIRFMGLERETRAQDYKRVLQEIAQGDFATALGEEVEAGFPSQPLLDEMLDGNNPISQAEDRLRKSMRLGDSGKKPD
ncbi:MAG: hypothetical protein BZY75_04495 [SAR202 cluster bacterium Io17-Chloro-G7]|nr:MAG: hypothetical protein BZY75_04495 [SAR202 cluster bacterium Io17-Chloro-G7]